MKKNLLITFQEILDSTDRRPEKASRLCDTIRNFGNYRWVGVYDVGEKEVSNIAWSGPSAPAYPRFPLTRGLTSAALANKTTVLSNNVANDPRYLTALDNTGSEIIVPVIDPVNNKVVGTVDVESERVNAFTEEDQKILEQCAALLGRHWL
jgi:putative methionine-R-sulfoxide reductase with GAF domain